MTPKSNGLSMRTLPTFSATDDLNDKNLFAYSDNNPVMRVDVGGEFWHIVVGTVIGGLISGISSAVTQKITTGSVDWGRVGTAALAGAASGALACTGIGAVGQMVGGATISMANNAVDQVIENKSLNNFYVGDMLIDGAVGAVADKLGGAGTGNNALKSSAKFIVSSVKNNTKNGVKGAVSRYIKAILFRAFTRHWTLLWNGIWTELCVIYFP